MEHCLDSALRGPPAGVRFLARSVQARNEAGTRLREWLAARNLDTGTRGSVDLSASSTVLRARLRCGETRAWTPGCNTLGLSRILGFEPGSPADLQREIAIGLLMSPVAFDFPDVDEFESAVRIRMLTVEAARRTVLDFAPEAIERPGDCWDYDPRTGFTVRAGHQLIDALRKATQPDLTGRRYAFSCYRATEYVMLLAIAQEAAQSNPSLLMRIQALAHRRAVQSREFHEVYLREYGSLRYPLPLGYFVPGDRVWFRNPDAASAQVEGYEGSWVIYLGAGQFCNFWQSDRPFTLEHKCLEIFHWRHAVCTDADGKLRIDEDEVEQRVADSLTDPARTHSILGRMQRARAPRGVFDRGGCLDATRECARWIRPTACGIAVPAE